MRCFTYGGERLSIVKWLQAWLSAPRTPLRLMVLGLILAAPSLTVGLFMDDFAHRSAFLGKGEIAELVRSPVLMFSFANVYRSWYSAASFC